MADLNARGLNPRFLGQKLRTYAYRCPKCGKWHLSTCKSAKDRALHDKQISQLQNSMQEKDRK